MFSLGPGELTLIVVALVLVFSTGRLPAMGDALGRLFRGKRAQTDAAKAAKIDAPDAPATPPVE